MLNTIAVLRKTTCGLAMISMIFMSFMQISATGTYTGQPAAVIAQNGEMSGHTMQNGEMSGHDMEEGGNAAEQTATREDSRVILSVFGGLAILVILVAGIMKYTRISKMRR